MPGLTQQIVSSCPRRDIPRTGYSTTRGFWPPRCPYLNSCHCYLWRLRRVGDHVVSPQTLQELKEDIPQEILGISQRVP